MGTDFNPFDYELTDEPHWISSEQAEELLGRLKGTGWMVFGGIRLKYVNTRIDNRTGSMLIWCDALEDHGEKRRYLRKRA